MSKINKDMPGDVRIKDDCGEFTFLADKKLDAELYAYLLSKSYGVNGETIVKDKDLDTVAEIIKLIRVKSRTTFYNHLKYLKEQQYIEERIIDGEKCYVLHNQSKFFFTIPLDTLKFLLDVVKDDVMKTYVYLGRQFEVNAARGVDGYEFTLTELGQHIGKKISNNGGEWEKLRNYIIALQDFGLIKTISYTKKKGNMDLQYLKIIKLEKNKNNLKHNEH